MKQLTVLISGAQGFIALHLAKQLRAKGIHVITASRSGTDDIFMDFSNPQQIQALKIPSIDLMIHMVSPKEHYYDSNPYYGVSEGASSILAALEFCVHNDIPRFIYLSSIHVFGNRAGLLDEQTLEEPINTYGLVHYFAEQTVALYNRMHKVKGWVVRASHVYGVPIDINRFHRWKLIPFDLCNSAIANKSILLRSSGRQYKNFVSVHDVCRAIEYVIQYEPELRTLHAYGSETMTVRDYALLVKQIGEEKLGMSIGFTSAEDHFQGKPIQFQSITPYQPTDYVAPFVEQLLTTLRDRREDA